MCALLACPNDNPPATTLESTGGTADTPADPSGDGPGGDPTGAPDPTTTVAPDTGDPTTADPPGTSSPGTTDATSGDAETTGSSSGDAETAGTSGPGGTTTSEETTTSGAMPGTSETGTSSGTDTTDTTDATGTTDTGTTGPVLPEMCEPGDSIPCYLGPDGTQDVGVCRGGEYQCTSEGHYDPVCEGQIVPVAEQCNGGDENCDGVAEGMLGPPILLGTPATFPRITGHGGGFVASWIDPFGKIVLQRLDTDGNKVGPAAPQIINTTIKDIEVEAYAGGIAVVYSNGTAYARSYDGALQPLAPLQQLGTPGTAAMEVDLKVVPLGGGSSQYLVAEVSRTFPLCALKTVAMPQGEPGAAVPLTPWATPIQFACSSVILGSNGLVSTDYGAVGMYFTGSVYTYSLRGFGPAGNFVWDSEVPLTGLFLANYDGDDLLMMRGNYRGKKVAVTDGSVIEELPDQTGLFPSGDYMGRFDTLYYNGSHQTIQCIDYTVSFSRFAKSGTLVPYEAKLLGYGSCGNPGMGISELRLAGSGGVVAMIYREDEGVYFRKLLCP